ncbi:TonB-dependent receptor, partial [Chryseobacterium sp.]|uniref:TonB-dependent receptor domain-containing protein n=1 Tax=Chryseobacterium sp. TaxID=1871047 RepID=UPI0025C46647
YTDASGNKVALANRSNYYSKPVMMLNWDWTMNEKSKLSTVLYMSNGRGGGTADIGKINGKNGINATFPNSTNQIYRDEQGYYNFDQIFKENAAVNINTGSPQNTLIRRSSINSHNWYGILANFQHKINDNWNFSVGTDDRYYYGYHYQIASDLYGASGFKDANNKNIPAKIITQTYDYKKLTWNPFGGSQVPMENRLGYSNDGEVLWYSGFGQIEYSNDKLSAFLQGSVSNQAYQRIDNFIIDGSVQRNQTVNTKTGFKNLLGYNIKGGVNYNIDKNNNVFGNIGYYSKQPFMNTVYPSNQQIVNPQLTNEKIFSAEIGYGYRSAKLNANVNIYRTEWRDRALRRGIQVPDVTDAYAEMNGITEIHQGVEVDATYKATNFLELNGMFSWGDYYYNGNATGTTFDGNNQPLTIAGNSNVTTLYIDKVKVGGSSSNSIPQMTASLGATIKPVKDLSIYGVWRYVGKLYSSIDIATFSNIANQERGTLKLPNYNLTDIGISYKIRLKDGSQYFTVGANIYNLFDTTYIQDGATNTFASDVPKYLADGKTLNTQNQTYEQLGYMYKGISNANRVYFGFGRTWAATLSFNF